MRASRSSRRHRRGGLAAAALAWPIAAAAQQIGPPIPLLPPSVAAPGETAGPQRPVASQQLPAPAPGWAGDIAPPADPLPSGFWDGTPRALAELLLARLPETTSPALQSLVRRLLLSPAAAPAGPDMPEQNLAVLRATALLRLGEIEAARAVVAAIPEAQRGAALPLAVDADAIGGNIDRACAIVRDRIRGDPTVGWQTALIACQALQGKIDEARLGLQLLAEEKAPRDEALAVAVDALAGVPAAAGAERTQRPGLLTLRVLVAAHRNPPPAVVEALPARPALTIALDAAAPPAARLEAATRAARLGALRPDRLRALYAELAGSGAPGVGPAHEVARDFDAIAQAGTAVDRLSHIIAFADRLASRDGGFAFAAALVAPLLHEIEPDPSLGGSAAAAARLLLAAGDFGGARRWAAFAAGAEAERLRFLLRLAGGGGALPSAAGKAESARLPLALALDEALGRRIEPADWLRLPAAAWTGPAAAAAPPAARLELAAAAGAKRIGETVLAAVLVAAPSGKLSADPVVLNAAISSLRRVGLDEDARRLAVEAALAAGF